MGYVPTLTPKPNPGRYDADRSCANCGARLSRNNPQALCAPCNGGDWDPPVQGHAVQIARLNMERHLEAAA